MERVTDAASVAGAERAGDVAIGRDVTFWDLADEIVDLGEEVHVLFSLALGSMYFT